MSLNILSYLLLETNQALFYQNFIEKGQADSFGISGLNIGSIVSFIFTLKNVKIPSDQFTRTIEETFNSLIESGIDM